MAHLNFRLLSITLGEEEDVREVTAAVSAGAHELIIGLVGPVMTMSSVPSGSVQTVILPVDVARKLFRAAGQLSGTDPRYDLGSTEVYDSLSAIFYGLMGE